MLSVSIHHPDAEILSIKMESRQGVTGEPMFFFLPRAYDNDFESHQAKKKYTQKIFSNYSQEPGV